MYTRRWRAASSIETLACRTTMPLAVSRMALAASVLNIKLWAVARQIRESGGLDD
ncbi:MULTISPECIES: hypothetical protein [Streptomyces]|uniref:hypothetical protein n=1 Tax=Streptomyces TaxID=1883 RepID=UPI0014316A3D|nr:hypothetical protein [Streptomyces melanosporofaciens]